MKKHCEMSALVLALFLAGCKSGRNSGVDEPSVEETQKWMKSFVADRGRGATYAGNACSGSITWLDKGSPYYTFSFSFRDLDPNTAKSVHTVVSPPALQNMWRATAVTTNNLKKVAVYNHQTKQSDQDSVIEGIPFSSSEDADRFAKALCRIITLCGGKPSPF
jgi:hypothetical protein